MAGKLSEDIDGLLEKYLHLLDHYTILRSQLNIAQSSIHQHIARANFSAERGIRYGPELYDARMQASRLCRITDPTQSPGSPELGTASLTLSTFAPHEVADGTQQLASENPAGVEAGLGALQLEDPNGDNEDRMEKGEEEEKKKKKKKKINTPKNPLRMFGILTPPSLRLAQTAAVEIIENLVPAIASLDIQMKAVEIQIRRARKHKLKAELLDEAEGQKSEEKKKDLSKQFLPGKRERTITS